MCVWNQTCSWSHPTNLMMHLPTLRMAQGWVCQQMVSGAVDMKKTFFGVRVFNPIAPSNRNLTPAAAYRKHEHEKKRTYEQSIREVEHSSFTPLVLSTSGGMGTEANIFYKRLASLLATKRDDQYCKTLCWLRCRLSFSLLRSCIQALRGARSSRGHNYSKTSHCY